MAEVTDVMALDKTAQTTALLLNALAGGIDTSWATATDETIAMLVELADKGEIDLARDFGWAVGDERVVSLSAIAASGTYEGVSWSVGKLQSAQDVCLVLMDTDHYYLEDGVTKCKFVVGTKNCLATAGYMNDTNTNTGSWKSCARRNWCNGGFRQAIPETLRSIFKKFQVVTAKTYNGSENETTSDYFALFATKEIFGTKEYSNQTEADALSQIEYYKTAANRVKKLGESSSSNDFWFTRSPYYDSNGHFNGVTSAGVAYNEYASTAIGISPFGVI